MNYEELTARVVAWAQTQPTIRALISVGSRARTNYPADRWSDLDLVIFCAERDAYVSSSAWLKTFGDSWLTYLEITGGGDPEWFALYGDSLKLDVVLLLIDPNAGDLESILAAHPYKAVFARGVNVLFDRHAPPRIVPAQPLRPSVFPTQSAYDTIANGFLVDALTMSKFIARGDLWRAERWLNEFLRASLLTMIEWQAHGKDTWYKGRFIEQWADPRVIAALHETFALYERTSLQNALLATLDLFRLIGTEVAVGFGLTYPTAAHETLRDVIVSSFAEANP